MLPVDAGQSHNDVLNRRLSEKYLFIECTTTYKHDLGSGIQRVVRNVLRNAKAVAAKHGYTAIPVILDGGRFIEVSEVAMLDNEATEKVSIRQILASSYRKFRDVTVKVIPNERFAKFVYAPSTQPGLTWLLLFPLVSLRALVNGLRRHIKAGQMSSDDLKGISRFSSHQGDVLLLLDSSWRDPVWPAVKQFKNNGGKVVSVVYDIIPLTHPETCGDANVLAFMPWFQNVLTVSDNIVAISRTIMNQISAHAKNHVPIDGHVRPVGYFYLGSELDVAEPVSELRARLNEAMTGSDPVFVVVGTIEPRKNLQFVLTAFERLWQGGSGCKLVIIGKNSWKSEALLSRINSHPKNGTLLFCFRDVTDQELEYIYRCASALIIASIVEGFGLPLVEAHQRGLPVLCSDIPVFREIANGWAKFFSLDAPEALVAVVEKFSISLPSSGLSVRTPGDWLTWSQSTEMLFNEVFGDNISENAMVELDS